MRIIAIIAVILLIVVFPVQSAGNAGVHTSTQAGYYNFTALNPGSFPPSDARFTFSNVSSAPGYNSSIEPGIGMNGLEVASQHYRKWSYFKSALDTGKGSLNVSALFSWNNRLSSSLTGDSIIIMNGTSTILNVTFGPAVGYGLKISASSVTENIGAEPAMNKVERISVIVPENSTFAYLEVGNSSFPGITLPVTIPVVYPGILNNLSIMIGGEYCNLTLYNLSFNHILPGSVASKVSPEQVSRKTSASAVSPEEFGNSSGERLVFRSINSIIYAGSNGSVYLFNYFNGSRVLLFSDELSHTVWISDIRHGSDAFFIISGKSSFYFVSFSTESFGLKSTLVNYTLPGRFIMQETGESIIVTGYYGGIDALNYLTPDIVYPIPAGGNISNSSGLQLLDARTSASSYFPVYYSSLNNTLTGYKVNVSSGTAEVCRFTRLSSFNSPIEILSYSSVNRSVSALIEGAPSGTDAVFNPWGMDVLPFTVNSTSFQASSGNLSLVSHSGSYYLDPGNGSLFSTTLPYGAGEGIWYMGNYGVLSVSGEVTVFSFNGADAFSQYTISVRGNGTYLVSGSNTVSLTVNSSLPYKLNVTYGNVSYDLINNSLLTVNSSALSNGMYRMSVIGMNTAGYKAFFNASLNIDNGFPSVNSSLEPSGYVSNTTVVNYSVVWQIGIRYINVSYLGSTFVLALNNGTFPLDTGNFSGDMNVSFRITDTFGRVFYYNYSETVIWNDPAGMSISMWNGEYLNSTSPVLRWTGIDYARFYSIDIYSGSRWENYTAYTNESTLSINNGAHSIFVYAALDNGSVVEVGQAGITVIDYAPSIIIRHSSDTAYSFNGNSQNSSLYCNLSSNTTALISMLLYSPSGNSVLRENASNRVNFTLHSGESFLSTSGTYILRITERGLSNLANTTVFRFTVNNSLPVNPATTGSTVYVNETYVSLKKGSYASSSLTGTLDGKPVNLSLGRNSSLNLAGEGEYRLNLTVYSNSMNYNASIFTVFYSTSPPEINFSLNSHLIARSSTLTIRVAVTDSVPVGNLTLVYSGVSVSYQNPPQSENYTLVFARDGNFTVTAMAEDYCSNRNETGFNVDVVYYPLLTSFSLHSSDFGILQDVHAEVRGDNVSAMREKWYVNGREHGNGDTLIWSLPLGFDNVTAVVTYGNKTFSRSETVFSTGPYIPAAGIALLVVFMAYRGHTGSGDPEKVSEFLASCNGLRVESIVKNAARSGVKRSAVIRAMDSLVEKNQAAFASDPDGKRYFRLRKS